MVQIIFLDTKHKKRICGLLSSTTFSWFYHIDATTIWSRQQKYCTEFDRPFLCQLCLELATLLKNHSFFCMCIFSTSLICIYVQTFSNILMFKKWNLIGYIAFCLLVYLNIVWSEVVGSLKYIFSCFYTKLLGYGLEWGRVFFTHEPESLWHECSPNPKWACLRAAAPSWPVGLAFSLKGIVYVESDCLSS